MKKAVVVLFLLFISNYGIAQNLMSKRWLLGGARVAQMVFTDTAKPIMKILYPYPPTVHYSDGGHSNICDSTTGKLLFSTNGMILYDSAGNIMDNGDDLVENKIYTHNAFPSNSATQGSLILPKGSNGLYYVFICSISDSTYTYNYTNPYGDFRFPYDRLEYSIVDMNQNNGLGKVIVKRQKLLQGVAIHKTMMQACRHSNGVDWWLLKQGEYDTNRIYRFLVKSDTIEGPWVQDFAAPKYPTYDLTGQYAFNPEGTKFVAIQGKGKMNKLFLADFDRCTGELNSPKIINIPIDSTTYANADNAGNLDSINAGVCFSPNGQFIYISKRCNIYQFEYQQSDSLLAWYRVQHGPDTTWAEFQQYGHLYNGMDKRMYVGYNGGLAYEGSVINKPDIKGVGCEFCRKCVRLTDTIGLGNGWGYTSPPNMPDYTLGASGVVCWPLQSVSVREESEPWEIYPNPTSTIFYIKNAQGKKKALYNMIGTKLLSTYKDEIEIKKYAKGIYFIRCEGVSKKVIIE
jgi:hypothetical protein